MFPEPVVIEPGPPVLVRPLRGLRFVNDGLLPCVGPVPGLGRRLPALDAPVTGCGIALPPRRGVVEAEALIDEDDVSLFMLLEDGCLGVIDPDFGVVVPDLGVVPPEESLPAADEGDSSNGLPSEANGIS